MRAEGADRVVVGYDMRDSSPGLAAAFADGVLAQGLDVVNIGLASTDQLYFASGRLGCPGAMFTASHNPARYNGIKLCRAHALPVGQDTGLATIAGELVAGVPAFDGVRGSSSEQNLLEAYAEFLRGLVDVSTVPPAEDRRRRRQRHGRLHRARGPGTHFGADGAAAVLPAGRVVPQPPEANPLEPSNLVDLQKFVVDTGADIGLAFDGDADRCFVVDERGEPVSPSAVTALVAGRELSREIGATVIHNLITSRAVPELVIERGGTPVRSRVGHSYIKALMADTGAIFGGEHSAHYYFRDFWGADCGMLAALHVLAALGEQDRPLSELMANYERYEASGEINFRVVDAPACVESVLKTFGTQVISLDHLDGVTVDLGEGAWFNLRTSNTEPLLRLNVEARSAEEIDEIVRKGFRGHRNSTERGDVSAAHATLDLDDTEGLLEADRDGLLRAAAMAGAQVRATAAAVDEGRGVEAQVAGGHRPRTVIWVAGRGAAESAGAMLAATLTGVAGEPIVVAAESPPWIGPLGVLIVAGDDAGDPALVTAAATAVRRGARVVVAAPY